MKQITAVIRPHMLEKVEHALRSLKHFPGYTLLRGKGEGRGRAPGHAYRAGDHGIHEHDRAILLIACTDELASQIVEAIRHAAHTGHPGDGLVTVAEAVSVVRIRSGEHDDAAL
ncbi:MAG: P-II family nitrogen regulator [Gammaproteobacteria bacterium]